MKYILLCLTLGFSLAACKVSEENTNQRTELSSNLDEDDSVDQEEEEPVRKKRRKRSSSSNSSGGGGGSGGGSGGNEDPSSNSGVCNMEPELKSAVLDELNINSCSSASSRLDEITSLRIRNISDSDLSSMDFSDFSNLRFLHLVSGNLRSLPASTFSGLSRLELLNLSDNDLNRLSPSIFSGLSTLEVLDLSDNDLDGNGVPANVFSGLSDNLEEVDLSGNNFSSSDETRIRNEIRGISSSIDVVF